MIMKYDVVIRCRNEMEWLPRVISSNNQSIKPSKIILVDNSSDDGSAEFAKKKTVLFSNMIRMSLIIVML